MHKGTDYPAAMLHYVNTLVAREDHAGVIEYYEANRDAIDPSGGSHAGEILHCTAQAFASLSNYTAALKTARTAQMILAQDGDSTPLAELFMTIGRILRDSGEIREAEKAYRDAESIFRRNDCIEAQARALNSLAGLFFRQQDYRNALSALMDALELARSIGDSRKMAFMTGNIGRIQTFIGNFAEAEKNLRINIDLSTELADFTEVARAQLSLGYIYIQQGNYEHAETVFEQAYGHIVAQNLKRDEVIYRTYLGELRYRQGQLDDAQEVLNRAVADANAIAPETTLVGRVLRHLAELNILQKNYRSARRNAARAKVIMEKGDDIVEQAALAKIEAICAEADGHGQKGREAFARAIDLVTRSGVEFEKAETLVAAGCSHLFEETRRMTYLFRAEEFYARGKMTGRLQKIEKLIAGIESRPRIAPTGAPAKGSRSGEAVFVTTSPSIKKFLAQLPVIGQSDLPLLLTGATGVGKDQMARYYHSVCRLDRPFVAVNCASVPETLLESELFGFRKGSFTGADSDRVGLFLAANTGVLYLDEIGDMPLALQAKLLGVLERRKVLPLGTSKEVDLDIKLVTATNCDLEGMVEAGTFRRDLYYRISGISFEIPALKDRKADIPLLLEHFMGHSVLADSDQLPPEVISRFIAYDWPGNVRELANKVKRLEVMTSMVAEGDLAELARSIFANDIPQADGNLFERVEEFERRLISEALLASAGNKSQAARILGIHEATVRTKLKRYGLSAEGGASA